MRYSAELDKEEGQTESAAAEETRESAEITEALEESAASDHVSNSVIAEEAAVSVTTSEGFVREASVDNVVEDEVEKSEVEVLSEEPSVAPTMIVTNADEVAQESLPVSHSKQSPPFVDLYCLPQLTVDIPSNESAIEQPRPWTPSYSVTSQGSPMRYTQELEKEELYSVPNAADEVIAPSQPSGDVVQVIEEPAATTEAAPDSVVVEKVVIPVETSENVVSGPEPIEEPQSPVIEPVRDDSEVRSYDRRFIYV